MKHFRTRFLKTGRLLFRFLMVLITIATVLMIGLAIIGQVVRDRTVELALLMYIPLLPLGLWAILLDILHAGRSLPRFRFSLTLMGLVLSIWGAFSMMGKGGSHAEAGIEVSVLHWNVYWGGKGGDGWQFISDDIQRMQPDIALLSEPPLKYQFQPFLKKMGWSTIQYQGKRRNTLAVCSSWPLQWEADVPIENADAMTVLVTVRGKVLRVLAVDGRRNMSERLVIGSKRVLPRWRTPMLNEIAQTLVDYEKRGKTIDLIAGDFNAISLSLGFDAFEPAGYHLASQFSLDWRGTWKAYLPLYDLDHVWVHKRFQGLRADLFTNLKSDHRGQLVRFVLPQSNRSPF
jgi:endonuclease/exonuclease/phosphatase (EEP) superfamily protein YafD